MTTWTQLLAAPHHRIVLTLEVTGLQYVFSTSTYTPSGTWYTDGLFLGSKPWLAWPDLSISESWSPIDGSLNVGGIDLAITDVDGSFSAMVKSWRSRNWTRLASSITATNTSMTVADASGFSAGGGYLWLDQECVRYLSISTNTISIQNRGAFGTEARAHTVRTSTTPPQMPIVSDGPSMLVGRRANLYAAVIDESSGEPGTAECIYRGVIAPGLQATRGEWRLSLTHASDLLRRDFGAELASAKVTQPCYYWGPESTHGTGYIYWSEGTAYYGPDTATVTMDFSGYQYTSQEELADAINAEFADAAAASNDYLVLSTDGERWMIQPNDTTPLGEIKLYVRTGDPLWLLGFQPGHYVWPTAIASTDDGFVVTAQDSCRALIYVELDAYAPTAATVTLTVESGMGELFEPGMPAMLPGCPWVMIESISTDDITLDLYDYDTRQWGGTSDDAWRARRLIVDLDGDATLRQLWPTMSRGGFGRNLTLSMQAALYQDSGQSEPQSWCVAGIESDDVDWDEFTDAVAGVSGSALQYDTPIAEPISWQEAFGPHMGLLGIAPRLTSFGRIGFARLSTPTELEASDIEVDDTLWSALDAAEVSVAIEGESLLNRVTVDYQWDYRNNRFARKADLVYHDGLAERGQARAVTYAARGLSTELRTDETGLGAAITALQPTIYGTHFGLYGRSAITIEIPCTYPAKQLLCGDTVRLTHPCVVDPTEGAVGVDGRLGIVIARRMQITAEGPDVLTVLLPAECNAGHITPCALATSWSSASRLLTIPSYTLYRRSDDSTDLSWMAAGQQVQLIPYDTESGSIVYSQIASTSIAGDGSAAYVTLATDPWSGGSLPTNGVYVVWRSWATADSDMRLWAWVASDAQTPVLGSDDAKEWAI